MTHYTNTDNPVDFPKVQKNSGLSNEAYIARLRDLWYEENDVNTAGMDAREIGIHVGIRIGIMRCIRELQKIEYGEDSINVNDCLDPEDSILGLL